MVAWRGGIARRSTSDLVPAYLAATLAVSRSISGASTGSALTTRRSGCSRPGCSDSATRATTNPSTSLPAKRTFTRAPGTAVSACAAVTL